MYVVSKAIIKYHEGQIGLLTQSEDCGSIFFIEIPIEPPELDSPRSPVRSFQPIRSRCEPSIVDDEDDYDRYYEREMIASSISSLSHYTKKQSNKTSKPFKTSPSTSRSTIPIIPYTYNDVMLNSCVYAGLTSSDREILSVEMDSHCKQIHCTKKDIDTISLIVNSLSSLKSINLIFLDVNLPTLHPAILIAKMRKLGYCGFAVLLSTDQSPATNERFLACGGDAILMKPLPKRKKAIQRVMIGEFHTCYQRHSFI